MIGLIVLLLVLAVIGIWLYGFLRANDFLVPTKAALDFNYKRILVIFPHPDDEAHSLSGTIRGFVKTKLNLNG